MSITFRPAKREKIPLLLGLAGGTGSGKTFSALLIAQGLAGGKPFAVVDTENSRARHYADDFRFDDCQLRAPFHPDKYTEAILAADEAGYPVIVVDSTSHEWEGDGGVIDMQEEILRRKAGEDAFKRDKLNMVAWAEAKRPHKRMMTQLVQVRAHVILCFRALEKVEMGKDEKGKTVVRPMRSLVGHDGWMPLTDHKRLPYELTMFFMLMASAPGVPLPIKLEDRHKPFVPLDKPLDATVGKRLAEWSAGTGTIDVEREQALEAELRALAQRLDAVEKTDAAVTTHRKRFPDTHARWLQAQIEIASAVLAERESAPAGEAKS